MLRFASLSSLLVKLYYYGVSSIQRVHDSVASSNENQLELKHASNERQFFDAESALRVYLGDNCIQNFHLGRYIVGYTVGNLVLRRRASGAVKRDFRTDIRQYTSPNENFEYGYPHSNALLQFYLELERCSTTSNEI